MDRVRDEWFVSLGDWERMALPSTVAGKLGRGEGCLRDIQFKMIGQLEMGDGRSAEKSGQER